MRVTFPHLGNVYIAAKALFDELEIDYVIPPLSSKKTLEIGSFYSPEEICLPFKINIGNYIQSIEAGADTIIMPGSCGPCRYGEYGELQQTLLWKLGYKVDFIVIDKPGAIGKGEFLNRIANITRDSKKNKQQKINALFKAIRVINLIENIEAIAHVKAGYELNKGESQKILKECKLEVIKCRSANDMIKLLFSYKKRLEAIKMDCTRNPIKVAIIGEIYTIIEPFSNLYIEDKLMDYGVASKRRLTPSWWFKNALLSVARINSIDIKRAAREYLDLDIGGHAHECVGEAVLAHEEGFDGAIQVFPLGCMPEIVAKSILPQISKDKGFPIMTLVVDEMTGEAGYTTRIEAFLDLLERRKECII